MRKVIVCNIMSLDGYYEEPNKNVMVLTMDPTPAFAALPGGSLRLIGTRTWDDSHNVLARYAVQHKEQ